MKANDGVIALLKTTAGPLIWFACFSALYAAATAACAGLMGPVSVLQGFVSIGIVLSGAAAQSGVLILGLSKPHVDESRAFLTSLTNALALLSLVATIWLLLPLAILPTDCPVPGASRGVS